MNDFRGVSHQTLSNYLNEHFLGSEGGVNAFRAAADTWKGTAHEAALLSLCRQVMADREDLRSLIDRLGYDGHPLKITFTHVVRLVGRVNPVNLLRRRQAGLAQVELDVLTGMLRAKLAMWETLLLVATKDPRFDAALLRDLQARATDQINQVRGIIEATWEERFFAG
ncbi:hypothetical protein OIU93_07235 [Paeniglutamicibacter sp. ZC-3]|uniref:hypothetical protein n=1 Tax=Paeniglutamicibacter TaxID=1742990 RepID=UPI0021F7174E|nr:MULTISPECIES: hypothetical protein [Paeniglutamicibacter]MCV9994093.1 hypothetical protein [Paeniglutamicibacter sp. ZC-3]MDO2935957.1 hypothetical protein [Paeniglutamicibacter sulfureus]